MGLGSTGAGMRSAAATDGADQKAFTAGREAAAAFTAAAVLAAVTSAADMPARVDPRAAAILEAAVMQAADMRAGAGPRAAVTQAVVMQEAAILVAVVTPAAATLADIQVGRRWADRIGPALLFGISRCCVGPKLA
jgi:hypothetical protein